MAKIYGLRAGDELPRKILEIAEKDGIATAKVEAIGGVRELRLAYYNHETKKYEEHDFSEFFEVTGLLGNLTIKDGRPFLHAHGTFGRRDLSVIGGHLVSATVFPLLEVTVTPTDNKAIREFDEETGLNTISKTE